MFSFKDVEDLYNNPKLIAHGQNVMRYVDQAISNFWLDEVEDKLDKLGKRHVLRGVQIPHYEVVG